MAGRRAGRTLSTTHWLCNLELVTPLSEFLFLVCKLGMALPTS